MKCPRCWAEKAYRGRLEGWKGFLAACLLLVPMKCHHCYHKFLVSWFMTLGKQIDPPPSRVALYTRPPGSVPGDVKRRTNVGGGQSPGTHR